jgi:hypothetical protein
VITRYALATDAIIAALQAASGMVDVFDGAPTPGFNPYEAVYIGWSGGEDDDTAGTITQEYHDIGVAAKRDETLSIDYVVQTVRGDDDMSTARTRAVEILGIVESTLRATPALGLDGVLFVEVSAGSVRQVRSADGIGVEITGSITVTGII